MSERGVAESSAWFSGRRTACQPVRPTATRLTAALKDSNISSKPSKHSNTGTWRGRETLPCPSIAYTLVPEERAKHLVYEASESDHHEHEHNHIELKFLHPNSRKTPSPFEQTPFLPISRHMLKFWKPKPFLWQLWQLEQLSILFAFWALRFLSSSIYSNIRYPWKIKDKYITTFW